MLFVLKRMHEALTTARFLATLPQAIEATSGALRGSSQISVVHCANVAPLEELVISYHTGAVFSLFVLVVIFSFAAGVWVGCNYTKRTNKNLHPVLNYNLGKVATRSRID